MSDTPETDAELIRMPYIGQNVSAEFARKLERRLAESEAKLAEAEKERDSLNERMNIIRVELGALFTMLPGKAYGLPISVCEDNADRQCLFRAFDAAIDAAKGKP